MGLSEMILDMTDPDRRSVLVVEDEPPIRLLLEDGLTTEGYAVRTASDAGEALSLLQSSSSDVVLLDLMLPGMNGLELARRIRERWPVCIVAMSASSNMLDIARHNPCVDKAVRKPFDWDSLIEDLEEVVA